MEPSQARLKEFFDYHDSGWLVWKKTKGSRTKIGSSAGGITVHGYYTVGFDQKKHQLSRLIYIWHNGDIGAFDIDHKDRVTTNNKITNLRICTRSFNNGNTKIPVTNTTGFKGVSYEKRRGKFEAYINFKSKKKHLGYYERPEDAAVAYNEAAVKYFGEFARLNKIDEMP